jgi:DNA (cytosine-5)-methyltransferase 1
VASGANVNLRLLDLYCGAGGASVGYQRAGFEVVGVDRVPQPFYRGGTFVQSEALAYLADHAGEFDAVHAAPLWHRFAPLTVATGSEHPDDVTPAFEALEATGLPYVLECGTLGPFPRGELSLLCGAAVGLEVVRHMWFRTNWPLMTAGCAHRHGGTTDGGYVAFRSSRWVSPGRTAPPRRKFRDWKDAAGVGWMPDSQARLSSPPAYTELIGYQLVQLVTAGRLEVAAAG